MTGPSPSFTTGTGLARPGCRIHARLPFPTMTSSFLPPVCLVRTLWGSLDPRGLTSHHRVEGGWVGVDAFEGLSSPSDVTTGPEWGSGPLSRVVPDTRTRRGVE